MIYVTGDTHSDFTRFTEESFPIQSEMKKMIMLLFVVILAEYGHLKKKVLEKRSIRLVKQ